ncbi:MAG: YraN family protein [Candidatus Campbellbacteria bacterium]|nr:YraN family protein [Candidatus Campbellbacteria bacterium]
MHPLTHLDIGQIGENAALRHYEKRGFRSIQQNYQKPFGEIDLIVEKDKKLVFVEVKECFM